MYKYKFEEIKDEYNIVSMYDDCAGMFYLYTKCLRIVGSIDKQETFEVVVPNYFEPLYRKIFRWIGLLKLLNRRKKGFSIKQIQIKSTKIK